MTTRTSAGPGSEGVATFSKWTRGSAAGAPRTALAASSSTTTPIALRLMATIIFPGSLEGGLHRPAVD